MAEPPGQVDSPILLGCLNFTAEEVGYPRSEALRLGLCAGLPLGSLSLAWVIIAGVRRARSRRPGAWTVPPAPPNTPQIPPRSSSAGPRGYGAIPLENLDLTISRAPARAGVSNPP
jgi:hypothetical protein